MDLILATNNDDKIREMSALLTDLDITLKTRRDFDSFPDIEETGATLKENAILKAQGIASTFGLPALADDSGLEVDALDGAPGVFSARFSGPEATYQSNCQKLLDDLIGIPTEKRTARFRCVIAIAWGDTVWGNSENDIASQKNIDIAEGTVEGQISEKPLGEGGFGYDSVFYYPPTNQTFAQISAAEKNRISHRGLALQKARKMLAKRLTPRQ